MDESTYRAIVDRLRQKGYDPARLEMTLQPVLPAGNEELQR